MLSYFRPQLLQWVQGGTETVVNFQKKCGVVPAVNKTEVAQVHHKKRLSESDKGNESDEDKSGASKSNKATKIKSQFYQNSGAAKKAAKTYGVPTNFIWHWLFTIGTAAGHEIFYIFILPFTYWNANHIVSRRSVALWVLCYYVGQACKDWLKLPRPPSPPVLRLSNFYEAEYGMPSTHAMGSVAISFSLVLATYQVGYDIPLIPWLLVAAAYTSVVCLSRLYMGAHTVADLLAGLFLSFSILGIYLLIGDAVDAWLATSYWVPVVIPALAVVMLKIYPAPKIWSESYGDTASFIAVGAGGLVGHWLAGTPVLVPGMIPEASVVNMSNIGYHILRCLVSYLVIGVSRSVIKQICLLIIPRLVLTPENEYPHNEPLHYDEEPNNDKKDKEKLYWKYFWGGYHQNYAVEIPTKLITYGTLAFLGFYLEALCDYIGLTL